MMDKVWKKLAAIGAGILAFFAGVFAFKTEHSKRKLAEEKLKQQEEKLQETKTKLEAKEKQDEKYVEYKKETEELHAAAVSGDDDAAIQLLHKAAESGNKRNRP